MRSKANAAPACSNPRHAPNPSPGANHWELEALLWRERRAIALTHPRETTTTNPACTYTQHSPEQAKFFTLMSSATIAKAHSCFVPCVS